MTTHFETLSVSVRDSYESVATRILSDYERAKADERVSDEVTMRGLLSSYVAIFGSGFVFEVLNWIKLEHGRDVSELYQTVTEIQFCQE